MNKYIYILLGLSFACSIIGGILKIVEYQFFGNILLTISVISGFSFGIMLFARVMSIRK